MNKTSKKLPRNYADMLIEVKERIHAAQYADLKAVNKELVALYWDIAKLIVERQVRESWEKSVIVRLVDNLQREFPGIKGFSVQNLWYMRQFYLEYCGNDKLQSLVGEISWSKNLVIMVRCKEFLEREFYIRMTRKFGWSKIVSFHPMYASPAARSGARHERSFSLSECRQLLAHSIDFRIFSWWNPNCFSEYP